MTKSLHWLLHTLLQQRAMVEGKVMVKSTGSGVRQAGIPIKGPCQLWHISPASLCVTSSYSSCVRWDHNYMHLDCYDSSKTAVPNSPQPKAGVPGSQPHPSLPKDFLNLTSSSIEWHKWHLPPLVGVVNNKLSNNKKSNNHSDIVTTSPSTSSVLELYMNLHNSAMRQLLSPFYKELSNDCDEEPCSGNAADSLECAGQCGLCGAPGVCGVHSWGRSPHYGPESMPILSSPRADGHLSLGPRSKLPGGWSPGFWSHLCFKLALPPGSVTIPPSSGLSCCNVRNGVRSLTKIPHHKERLEVQTNVEPVSECLTSLCPLVDTSSLAPGGNRLETPELCDLSQGFPPLRSIKCG